VSETLLAAALREPGRRVVLSGACGTEIQRRGVPTPLPLWSAHALFDAPETVKHVHADYVAAGADVLTANTFRADRRTLSKAGRRTRARDLVKAAVRFAREAAGEEGVAVAGSIGPLEDCYRPDLVPKEAVLRAEHGARVGDLVAAGADLAMVETMSTVAEAVAALGACAAGGLPAAVSFCAASGTTLLSGESLTHAVDAVRRLRPLAICVNCCSVDVATAAVETLTRAAGDVPVGAYANGVGRPDPATGWALDPAVGAGPDAYLAAVDRWVAAGARWIGGCCGTTPEYVRRIAERIGRA
jgi:S-methylmethionine-dependent homocysteine/selenocysteine methylase